MDAEAIATLKAGSALDHLIAEQVMDWHAGSPAFGWVDAAGNNTNRLVVDSEDYYDHTPAWSPSTNMADAWDVVEKVKSLKPCEHRSPCDTFTILHSPHWAEHLWTAGWSDFAGGEIVSSVEATAETAALAICRAALLAIYAKRQA